MCTPNYVYCWDEWSHSVVQFQLTWSWRSKILTSWCLGRFSHNIFTSVLWFLLHWNNPELLMKSKHGQQYQQATVWTRGDRAAKPRSQPGAQINRQDRRSVCVYSSLWLRLSGTKALFKQVRTVQNWMQSFINEDMLRSPGSGIMTSIIRHTASSFLTSAQLEPPLHLHI